MISTKRAASDEATTCTPTVANQADAANKKSDALDQLARDCPWSWPPDAGPEPVDCPDYVEAVAQLDAFLETCTADELDEFLTEISGIEINDGQVVHLPARIPREADRQDTALVVEALRYLKREGAVLMRCGKNKNQIPKGNRTGAHDWPGDTLEHLIAHAERGGLIGYIPQSLQSVTLDLDLPDDKADHMKRGFPDLKNCGTPEEKRTWISSTADAITATWEQLRHNQKNVHPFTHWACYATPSGGLHILVKCSDFSGLTPVMNGWHVLNNPRAIMDLRSVFGGYVVCYNLPLLAKCHRKREAAFAVTGQQLLEVIEKPAKKKTLMSLSPGDMPNADEGRKRTSSKKPGKFGHSDLTQAEWQEAYEAKVGVGLLKSRSGELHGPCPCCGGENRFVLFQDPGSGAWCRKNQCGIVEIKRALGLMSPGPKLKRRKGRPVISVAADGLADALAEIGIEIRLNLRGEVAELRQVTPGGPLGDVGTDWRTLQRRTQNVICETVRERFLTEGKPKNGQVTYGPAVFGRDRWPACRDVLLTRNQVDPFLEWIESLPKLDLEAGNARYGCWLEDLFEIDPMWQPLAEWASRFLVLGPLARACRPGCKLDQSPVLIGHGDLGKSTLLMELFPDQLQYLHNDTFRLTDDLKRQVEAVKRSVIVEISEMAGLLRADPDVLKIFFTSRNDRVRLSYAEQEENLRRAFVFVGTANRGQAIPSDRDLARRFVAVPLEGESAQVPIEQYMAEHRAALWAWGLAMLDAGMTAQLPRSMKCTQREVNETQIVEVPLDELVQPVVGHIPDVGWTLQQIREKSAEIVAAGRVVAGEEAAAAQNVALRAMDRATTREWAQCLRRLGLENKVQRLPGIGLSRRWIVVQN